MSTGDAAAIRWSRAYAPALLPNLMATRTDVQKALDWAYRSLTVGDRPATGTGAARRINRAARDGDGPPRAGSSETARQARFLHGRPELR